MKIEKLIPECKDYLWGGEKLIKKYGKITKNAICAESWELSFHEAGLTRLQNGKTLKESVSSEDLGEKVNSFVHFPVLVKMIDAKDFLSVQVHPNDDYALKNENSLGKTEMWYVVEAEEGAGIYLGFKDFYTQKQVEDAVKDNTLTDLLRFCPVKAGDCFFIPAGTVHAIGRGCLICEIQQNSNLTYRFYDYGRGRELHLEKAFKVSKLEPYVAPEFSNGVLGECAYFCAEKLDVNNSVKISLDHSSFNCVTCVAGQGVIEGEEIKAGDSYFIPAHYNEYTLQGNMQIIKVYLP